MPDDNITSPLSPQDPPLGKMVVCHSCHICIRDGERPVYYRLCETCQRIVNVEQASVVLFPDWGRM